MLATTTTMYQCPRCGELYEYDFDADGCCDEGSDRVNVWECGNCGTHYDDQDHARECCWDGETDLEPYILVPAELERFGQ